MARAASLWLAAVFCFNIYICYSLVDGLPQGSIIRAKRELDENFEDALYEKEEGLLSKRETNEQEDKSPEKGETKASVTEEKASESAKKSETGDNVAIDSEESIEAKSNEASEKDNGAEASAAKDEKPTQAEEQDAKAETRHNVEGKNADNLSKNLLKKGMDANVDNPLTNGDLIKKYDPSTDTSNGDMLGMSKRTDIVTKPNDIADSNTKPDTDAKRNELPNVSKTEETDDSGLEKRQTISEPKLVKRSEKETHDIQEAGAPSHFQVDDKSADLEINANSAGVKVKAKPASLQVVSRPGQHGAPMMPFMPPPIPVMHHMPHHHRHHHHHHRRHHYEHPVFVAPFYPHHEEYMPFGHFGGHEGGFEEPHYFAPYHHGEEGDGYGHPHWGEGYGDGYHLYGRHRVDGGLYGRSTVETAQDPRLSAPAALDGFNSGIALPEMDQRFMRISHVNGPNFRFQHFEDDFKGGPPTMEEESLAAQGEYRYHVPRAPIPEEEEHHHSRRLKRRYQPEHKFTDFAPKEAR